MGQAVFLHEKYFGIFCYYLTHTPPFSQKQVLVVVVRAYKGLKPAVLYLLHAGWFRGVTPRGVTVSSVSLYCGDRRGVTAGCGVSQAKRVFSHSKAERRELGPPLTTGPSSFCLLLTSTDLVVEQKWKNWMEKFVNLRMLQRVWQKFGFLVSGNKRMMNRQYADTAGLSLTHTYGTFMCIFWRSKFKRCLINIDCIVYGTGTFWYPYILIVTTERGC